MRHLKQQTVFVLGMLLGASLFWLFNSANASAASEQDAEDRAAIEALHSKDLAAGKAGDVNTLATLWTDDGVVLPPARDPIIGIAAIQKWVESNPPNFTKFTLTELVMDFKDVQIVGDTAYEWGFTRLSFVPKGGSGQHLSSKLMRVLRRQPDGSWKVARSMWNDDPVVVDRPSPSSAPERK